jgi:hypothetical protein
MSTKLLNLEVGKSRLGYSVIKRVKLVMNTPFHHNCTFPERKFIILFSLKLFYYGKYQSLVLLIVVTDENIRMLIQATKGKQQ